MNIILIMIIGLARGFEFYRNEVLWREFFGSLGVETIVSAPSTRAVLEAGARLSIDESCLSSKIYLGHIASLIGKCDAILVPRLDSLSKTEFACTKFNALYDIVANVFDVRIVDYNIDVRKGFGEERAYVEMGKSLGASAATARGAYFFAKNKQRRANDIRFEKQRRQLFCTQPKVLVVGHDYNVYDALIGSPFLDMLKKMGCEVILACESDKDSCAKLSTSLSPTLFWRFSKELIGAIELYRRHIDGVVFLTTFPCGPDSLVNELMLRKYADRFAMMNLVFDEHQSQTGLQTRAESFFDLLLSRKKIDA